MGPMKMPRGMMAQPELRKPFDRLAIDVTAWLARR